MKKIIIHLLFVFASIFLTAQTKRTDAHIVGHVLDKNTGKHLPFVHVTLKGTTIGTTTDKTGHFFLKNLPVGEHILVFSALGYKSLEYQIEIQPNTLQEINVELEPDVFMLEQVVVSASRAEKELKESAVQVQVIHSKQMEMQGVTNLADALSTIAGLRVEGTCQNCGFMQVRINGLEGQYTQLLIDGYPIMSALSRVYALEQIPFTMIERIEVVRGGGSALYGSSAIAGTINIITREPAGRHTYVAHQSKLIGMKSLAHSTNLYTSMVSDDARFATSIFAASQYRKHFDANGDGFSEIPFMKMLNVGLKSQYRPGTRSKMRIEYHIIDDFRRGGNKFTLPPHQTDITELAESSIHSGNISFQTFSANQKQMLKVYAAGQFINRCSYYGTQQDPNAYGNTDDWTGVIGSQHQLNTSIHERIKLTYTHGLELFVNKLIDEFPSYHRFIYQSVYNQSYFAQTEFTSSKFSFLAGARLDKHNMLNQVVLSPRTVVKYHILDALSLRAGLSTGYLAPQTFAEDLHITAVGGTGVVIVNDPELKPEFSRNYFSSLEYVFSNKYVNALISFEGFFTSLRETFVFVEDEPDQNHNIILLRTNASGARIKGIHSEMKLFFKNGVNISAGFTFQQGKYDEPLYWSSDAGVSPLQHIIRMPRDYGYISFEIEPLPSWQLYVSNNYTGPMYVPHYAGYIEKDTIIRTQPFHDITIQVHKMFLTVSNVQIQLSAGVQNILNSYQKDFDKGQKRDSGYIYGPTYPRTYLIGIRFLL